MEQTSELKSCGQNRCMGNKYSLLVEAACDYLIENISTDISMNKLARSVASNRNTLSLAFREVLGTSVFAWLRVQRMRRAAKLLASTDYSVLQISIDVGYRSPSNFATTFKEEYSMSPRQYRKNTQSKKDNDAKKVLI